ncbi:uncharacterized protein AB675_6423 [Cyphellophora attinorum]|uniref:Vacuolar ATPase assembly protein VMA22 n=1 Tax=Cyphellophora attinorum TaxID=1664694 RepID=A0A0N1HZB9_9EURO|nr:uncharacterized protein AB675_6423 [Phialophora attinorum]KPI44087.1 hypothetical protein AB675_6423 [Phialophora attinorum]
MAASHDDSDAENLIDRLDDLLAQHLDLLDSYTTLRTQLSEQFSSGFFSLAAANRNAAASLGAGRRFGSDGFDGRTKAGRVVKIAAEVDKTEEQEAKEEKTGSKAAEGAEDVPNGGPSLVEPESRQGISEKTEQWLPPAKTTGAASKTIPDQANAADLSARLSSLTLPTTPANPTFSITQIQPGSSTPSAEANDSPTTTKSKLPRNPLNWYTPLPPPALRQTQQTFVSSLDTLAAVINATEALDALDARCEA